jgi:hypothetical protein
MNIEFAKALAEQVELSSTIITEQAATIEKQAGLLADLQKSAAAPQAATLTHEAVAATLDKLVDAHLVPASEKVAFAARMQEPAILLTMLNKIAEAEQQKVPRLGRVDDTPVSAPTARASDALWAERFGR